MANRLVGILIIDVWDNHWDEKTLKLMKGGFGSNIDRFLKRVRKCSLVIHTPSNCERYYRDKSGAEVMDEFRDVEKGKLFWGYVTYAHQDVVWEREHESIEIEPEDYVLFEARKIFSVLKQNGIKKVYLVGLHLDMCIMGNDWGACNLRKYGFEPVIVEDLVEPLMLNKDLALADIRNEGYATIKCADIKCDRQKSLAF